MQANVHSCLFYLSIEMSCIATGLRQIRAVFAD